MASRRSVDNSAAGTRLLWRGMRLFDWYPPSRKYRSFRVWALACSGAEDTITWANELLADDPDNPLACLAQMLNALRAGEITEAVEWVRRAGSGRPIPKARELERAVAALTLLGQQEQLPVEKAIIVGVLYLTDNRRVLARDVLTRFLEQENNSPWPWSGSKLVRRSRRQLMWNFSRFSAQAG